MNFTPTNINLPSDPASAILIAILTIWSLATKGYALWHASQNQQKYWFIAILVINTVGILEIIYLFVFAKKKLKFAQVVEKIKNKIASIS